MSRFHKAITAGLAIALAGCASHPAQVCQTGEQPAIVESLYFGTAKPNGVVTPEQWQGFVNQTVTPRFPDGLTTWQASGQWRGESGVIERERSHVLQLVHPASRENESAIEAIMDEYKSRFQQEAVLRVRSVACISF